MIVSQKKMTDANVFRIMDNLMLLSQQKILVVAVTQ
jgi:hypothetical protein